MEKVNNYKLSKRRESSPSFIDELNKYFEQQEIILIYEGKIEQEVIKVISNEVKKKMELKHESLKLQGVIFHLIVEMLQNISKYSDDKEIGKGIIAIGKVSGKYCIYGGNKISNEKIAPMELFINTINNMNASHLTELYERKISNLGFNVQGGAGLGLIDMIRKSKQKLQYSFEPLTQGVSFFMVTATVFSN